MDVCSLKLPIICCAILLFKAIGHLLAKFMATVRVSIKAIVTAKAVALMLMLTAALLTEALITKSQAQTYYLGVLAPQGESAAQQRWQPWLDKINAKLAEDTIVLVPLALENWQEQIEAQQFAWVLGPQVQFIKMDTIGWRWLATLQADSEQLQTGTMANQPTAMEQVASALWVTAASDIYQLADLQQRKIVAVDPKAFGGYLLVAHLLQQNGLAPKHYQTRFVGYPIERTLNTLASGTVDAAIAPLCLMEEMARQGKIDQSQYRLIHPVATHSNCQSSTKIYPNWTLAATGQAPVELSRQVSQQLFALQQQRTDGDTDISINSAAELRWMPPESSVDTERILYEMGQHPAQKQLGLSILDWIKSHRLWVGLIAFIIIISTINYGWMSWLAWRRRQQILLQNKLLRDYDHRLRQSERFAALGEMSGAIAHEINQPLATIQNYAQGLLIRSQNTDVQQQHINKVQPNSELIGQQPTDQQLADQQHQPIAPDMLEKNKVENALQQIVNETERVAAVIHNIRRWAGRLQPDEIKVDIAATYRQCILLLGEKALGISFWFASDYQQLYLPRLLLDQLLINAVLNAQQQGAHHIMLRCQKTECHGKSWLALHISDDAGGFDASRLLNNQAFAQADKPLVDQPPHVAINSTKADGLGLGLMICQRLCKSLEGRMQLHNVDGQTELAAISQISGHYQQRIKRSLNGKVQLLATHSCYPLLHNNGAQVTFYLPITLAQVPTKDNQ